MTNHEHAPYSGDPPRLLTTDEAARALAQVGPAAEEAVPGLVVALKDSDVNVRLTAAEFFERFLDRKYTGTKRFGLEGGESTIPALEQILKRGSQLGIDEVVIGMPHRGRLNVLANLMNKPFAAIFAEFQGNPANPEDVQGSGDWGPTETAIGLVLDLERQLQAVQAEYKTLMEKDVAAYNQSIAGSGLEPLKTTGAPPPPPRTGGRFGGN